MKTTVELPDHLIREAKTLASRRGVPLKSVLEAALREHLANQQRANGFRLKDVSFGSGGLQEGLSWDKLHAIRSLSYEGRGA